MGRACDEVDELKAEIEKLKKDCHTKKEQFESLRKANNELLLKLKEVKTLGEQKHLELQANNKELSEVRQISEKLKSSLEEKESTFRHLNFVNEKLRVEYSEKVKLLEEQNKGLILALDEATVEILEGERKLCSGVEEIQGLKRLLSSAEKKCLEEDEIRKASKELKCRDDVILEVEEENRNFKDRLKWKSEQFEHLEEAHELLQNQFHQGKIEWGREKSDLLKVLHSLKISLDSQTKISENFRSQLKICNQALSHEESKRKMLEIEVVELRSHFDNVALEFEEARSKIENLTLLRDEDLAELRSELGTKEALTKEMKYKIAHLELENKELQELLKECREEQIKLAGGVSVKKLETKLKRLEQVHGECSVKLKKKESEWNSRYEKMIEVVNGNLADLKSKDSDIQELRKRLECCHNLMEFQSENEKAMLCEEAGLQVKEFAQLGDGRSASPTEDDGVRVLDEVSNCQARLKEHFEHMETNLRRSSEVILHALELANNELVNKTNEVDQTKHELHVWKFNAEVAKIHLQESLDILRRENDSLVGMVKDQDEKLSNFEKQVFLFDAKIAAKMDALKALEQENEHYYQVAENKESDIIELKNKISRLKQESEESEKKVVIQVHLDAEKISKQEKERLLQIINEKDHTLEDLRSWVISADQGFERELVHSFSQIIEYQIKLDMLIEDMEKAQKLKQLEIEAKNMAIGELEKGKHDLFQELIFLKESCLRSSNQLAELKAELETQRSETNEVNNHFSSKQAQVLELQQEKENLMLEVINMHSQKDDMIKQIEAVHDWIGELSRKDAEMTNTLENIVQNTEDNYGQVIYSTCDDFTGTVLSPSTKSERESNQRSPLKALKNQ